MKESKRKNYISAATIYVNQNLRLQSLYFYRFKEPRNRGQGIDFASLGMAARYVKYGPLQARNRFLGPLIVYKFGL
jgi:hypothetical protein